MRRHSYYRSVDRRSGQIYRHSWWRLCDSNEWVWAMTCMLAAAPLVIGCLCLLAVAVVVLMLGRCRHRTWYVSGYLIICEGCGKVRDRTE